MKRVNCDLTRGKMQPATFPKGGNESLFPFSSDRNILREKVRNYSFHGANNSYVSITRLKLLIQELIVFHVHYYIGNITLESMSQMFILL